MSVSEAARDAEQAVLGGMLLSPAAMWEVLDILGPRDFDTPRHELIYTTITALARRQETVDTYSVTDELIKTGELDRAGGADYLHTLTSMVPTAANAGFYAEIVQRHAGLRRVHEAAGALMEGAAAGEDVMGLADKARSILDGVVHSRVRVEPVGESMTAYLESLEKPPLHRPTPWPDLNGYLVGLQPGCVYVIAARPGHGKTIAGLQLAKSLCQYGPVTFHSLEMTKGQLIQRLTASESDVSLNTLDRHRLTADDWHAVAGARARIQEMPLFIDDEGHSLLQIESFARRVGRGGLAGMVVDYLQLIPTTDSRKPRHEYVGELTRAFKMLAKSMNVPVILLCQLNRESERMKRLPGLADLRESGSIEQDADVVVMLQRRLDNDGRYTNTLDAVVAKNRHGQQGHIELEWQGKFARFMPMRWGTPSLDFAARQAADDR